MSVFRVAGAAGLVGVARAAVVVAVACLAGAYHTGEDIGSAFLLGAYFACLVGAVLILCYAALVGRSAVAGEPSLEDTAPRSVSLLARFAHRPSVAITVHRQTTSRLSGVLTVQNNARVPVRLAAMRVRRPDGSKLATADDSEAAKAITVHFEGSRVEVGREIAPGALDVQRFFVLLPSGETDGRTLHLDVDLRDEGAAPRDHQQTARARIPQ